jgi:hypothetical protein
MSYDTDPADVPSLRHVLAQERERTRSMRAERDANCDALDRLRARLRLIVPDVPEGHDLVAAVERRLALPPGESPDAGGVPCASCGVPVEGVISSTMPVVCGPCSDPAPPASPASLRAVPDQTVSVERMRHVLTENAIDPVMAQAMIDTALDGAPPESGRAPDLAKIRRLVTDYGSACRADGTHDLPEPHPRTVASRAAVDAAVRALAGERDEARRLAAEGRQAGRAEAAQMLMDRIEPEHFDPEGKDTRGLLDSVSSGESGDWSAAWAPEKVRELFDVSADGGVMGSLLERLDGSYWAAEGRRDDAVRRAEAAEKERDEARQAAFERTAARDGLLDVEARLRERLSGARRLPECRSVTVCCYCGLDAAGPTEVIEHVARCAKSPWPARLSSARRDAIEEALGLLGRIVPGEVRGLEGLTLTGPERDDWIVRATARKTIAMVGDQLRSLAASLRAEPGARGAPVDDPRVETCRCQAVDYPHAHIRVQPEKWAIVSRAPSPGSSGPAPLPASGGAALTASERDELRAMGVGWAGTDGRTKEATDAWNAAGHHLLAWLDLKPLLPRLGCGEVALTLPASSDADDPGIAWAEEQGLDMPPDGSDVGFRHDTDRPHPCDFACGGRWVCIRCRAEWREGEIEHGPVCPTRPVTPEPSAATPDATTCGLRGHDWRDGRLLERGENGSETYDEEWCGRCGARLSEVESYSDEPPAPGDRETTPAPSPTNPNERK